MKKVIVVGGGAAGMMAAIFAARNNNEVIIIEKNEKLGKKLYITGKGRCNITNACDMEEVFENVVSNRKFLYSAFYAFSNIEVMEFFEQLGCRLKTERGNRVFPVSDKSSDVITALNRECKRLHILLKYDTVVERIVVEDGICKGVIVNHKRIDANAVILATGGLSYESTGSTGDGYRFAKSVGHTLMEPSQALVPMETKEEDPAKMQGLSLKNIEVSFWSNNGNTSLGEKCFYKEFGEMIFTHFGVSGPVIISGSSFCKKYMDKGNVKIKIDLKPALLPEQLDARILRDFEKMKNSQFKNALNHLLPKTMIPIIVKRSDILPEKQVNLITKEERKRLVNCMKEFSLQIKGFRGYNEAIITKGGIKTSEINPSTMESKLVKDLYFAGEMIDLDALTGGFNLQIAWSTGYLAGSSVKG